MSTNWGLGFKSFANLLSYIAVIFVGVALILQKVLDGGQIAQILKMIAEIFAYVILAISSFAYARSRRSIIFVLVWVVAVVLIIVSYII